MTLKMNTRKSFIKSVSLKKRSATQQQVRTTSKNTIFRLFINSPLKVHCEKEHLLVFTVCFKKTSYNFCKLFQRFAIDHERENNNNKKILLSHDFVGNVGDFRYYSVHNAHSHMSCSIL